MDSPLVELLKTGVSGGAAGLAISAVYRPGGFPSGTVMPPTFGGDGDPYLTEERWIDGERRSTVVLDQVPSQSNRVEEALLLARDEGRITLPLFELRTSTSRGPVRLTSLEFPHRYADAYLRDSTVDGVRFDRSPVGARLREASSADVRPLYERDPGALIYGAWDSHRKGRWPKFARVYRSFMYGLDPLGGQRRTTRMDPLNLTGAIDDKAKAESDWQFVPHGTKQRGTKPSEIGHGNIKPGVAHGGVAIREARREGWISFAGLERLRFGDAPREAVVAARAALAALALAGDRLAFDRPGLFLRSGCDLVRAEESVGVDRGSSGTVEPVSAGVAEAVAAFEQLREEAAAAGIAMATDTVVVEPIPGLAKAIEFSLSQSAGEE